MTRNLIPQTPSQTVGPYFAFGLASVQYGYDFPQIATGTMARAETPGEHIRLVGRVIDGAGEPIPDALVEIWQADAAGRYAAPEAFEDKNAFHGFGRVGTGTDPDNRFVFDTVKPGSHDGEAPHLNVIITMRGMLLHVFTRIYFSDEAEANAACPVLTLVPADRRETLIARRRETPGGAVYEFDFHMQGNDETVFFDV